VLHVLVISGSWGIHLAGINSTSGDGDTDWKTIGNLCTSVAERNEAVPKILGKEEQGEG
jgi:hypothetical protein